MLTHWKNNSPPSPPFYAVIFISRKGHKLAGYAAMDERMMALAKQQPGYLGYSSSSVDGEGIFISYWTDQQSIEQWRKNQEHREAKEGAKGWYTYYHSMISRVESSHILGSPLKNLREEE